MEFTSFGQADKQAHVKYARQEVMMRMKNVWMHMKLDSFAQRLLICLLEHRVDMKPLLAG